MPPPLEEIMSYLAGKSVAIVGNATSLLQHRYGDFIDGHDVVVRMNNGVPIDVPAQGRRFDVCCFSTMRVAGKVLRKARPRFAVWMSPNLREEYDGRGRVCFYPLDHWQALRNDLGARPSVGAMTVDLVARSSLRTASIIGFDFKRTGTFYESGLKAGPHDFGAESRYVLGMAEARSWRFVELGFADASQR